MKWEAFTEDHFSGWWAIRDADTKKELGSTDGGFSEEQAKLLASAPLLLEALEASQVALRNWAMLYPESVDYLDTRANHKAQEAIKAVKGLL